MKKAISAIALALTLAFLIASTGGGAEGIKGKCAVCGADLQKHSHTLCIAVFEDGTEKTYCSLYCLAIGLLKEGKVTEEVEVADYLTGELIPSEKAFFLAGSDIPSRGPVSIIAFSSTEDLMKYYEKHGGSVLHFCDAYGVANNHLNEYREMLKKEGREIK